MDLKQALMSVKRGDIVFEKVTRDGLVTLCSPVIVARLVSSRVDHVMVLVDCDGKQKTVTFDTREFSVVTKYGVPLFDE